VPKTWEEIAHILERRRQDDAALIRTMIDTRDRYNADVVIPLPDVKGEPISPPLGPQVIHDGIEHNSMRAASTMPTIACPALDPGKSTGVRSVEYAGIRRKALAANYDYNFMSILLGRAFRQLSAYGTFAMVAVPDFRSERTRLELRPTLNTYPDPRAYDDYQPPLDCGFVYGRSAHWLKLNYGAQVERYLDGCSDSDLFDVAEWIDGETIALGVIARREGLGIDPNRVVAGLELRRWPNRANGLVPVAVGKRITLDRVAGQMEIITGSADWLDKLMALQVMAAERNVFPDMYAIADDNREVELAGNEWHDGRTGKLNVLGNTKAVGQLISGPSPAAQTVVGQLERAARSSGGAIAQFGGEAPGSLRTGRAIDTLGAFAVDPRVAEMQRVMEAALSRTINPSILEIEKGYWPDKKYVCFSGSVADPGFVEYVPKTHFESTENAVRYAFPGMEISSISIALLQLVGGDLIPKSQARAQHPMIENPDEAGKQILVERIDETLMISLQQDATRGVLPAIDLARIRELIVEGKDIHEAILTANQEAQARQAAEVPETPPGMQAPPETMPGLGQAGIGAELGQMGQLAPEGVPQVQGPLPSQENLRHLVRTLRTGQ
jgi:hypothetical protein